MEITKQEDDGDHSEMIDVEVAFARPEKQRIISLRVAEGTSAYDAVVASGIVNEFPEIKPDSDPMGIFSKPLNGKGRPLPAEYRLRAGDRVEIYRPLTIDPKQARLQRAREKELAKSRGKEAKKDTIRDARKDAKETGK